VIAQVVAAVAVWVFLSGRQDPFAIANAVFLTGMPCFLYGLWRIVSRLGLFDVVTYSFRHLWAVIGASRRGGEPMPPELASLMDYSRSKPPVRWPYEHLVGGGVWILISFLLS
jgi:hypothetical protein